MIVPCAMGLRCSHVIYDEDGDPVCCHPHTIDTIDEERWEEAHGLCMDMTECPMVGKNSDLEYLLRFTADYNPEEWASLMSMLRVAVHRRDRAAPDLDAMREEATAYIFGLHRDMLHRQCLERRGSE